MRLKLPPKVSDKPLVEIAPNPASIFHSGFVRIASITTQKNVIFDISVVQRAGGGVSAKRCFSIILQDANDSVAKKGSKGKYVTVA